ncbi:MAG: hypothetical protein KC680_00010 [Candidatus Peregrinibacteria bacterium]|nr:hypothetical protein [Candidatus Peregrinibacteria bacterium]MCB9808106.1 hypothetical protein [Candidatus Peribacteria bacterium]
MLQKETPMARTLLPLAFFGILVSLLVFSESMSGTTATSIIMNVLSPGQECTTNDDCSVQTTYCDEQGRCKELNDPTCDCGQPQVLRCYEESGRARFMYCPNGCKETPEGAICE